MKYWVNEVLEVIFAYFYGPFYILKLQEYSTKTCPINVFSIIKWLHILATSIAYFKPWNRDLSLSLHTALSTLQKLLLMQTT